MFGMPSVLSEKDAQCILYRINYSVDVDIKYSLPSFTVPPKPKFTSYILSIRFQIHFFWLNVLATFKVAKPSSNFLILNSVLMVLFQLLAGINGSNLHFVFCPLRFQNSFQMQPIQWMRVKMQSYSSIQHYLEYNRIPHFRRLFLLLEV
jgi:hypothetical protein